MEARDPAVKYWRQGEENKSNSYMTPAQDMEGNTLTPNLTPEQLKQKKLDDAIVAAEQARQKALGTAKAMGEMAAEGSPPPGAPGQLIKTPQQGLGVGLDAGMYVEEAKKAGEEAVQASQLSTEGQATEARIKTLEEAVEASLKREVESAKQASANAVPTPTIDEFNTREQIAEYQEKQRQKEVEAARDLKIQQEADRLKAEEDKKVQEATPWSNPEDTLPLSEWRQGIIQFTSAVQALALQLPNLTNQLQGVNYQNFNNNLGKDLAVTTTGTSSKSTSSTNVLTDNRVVNIDVKSEIDVDRLQQILQNELTRTGFSAVNV